jgi:hypothetical protein
VKRGRTCGNESPTVADQEWARVRLFSTFRVFPWTATAVSDVSEVATDHIEAHLAGRASRLGAGNELEPRVAIDEPADQPRTRDPIDDNVVSLPRRTAAKPREVTVGASRTHRAGRGPSSSRAPRRCARGAGRF